MYKIIESSKPYDDILIIVNDSTIHVFDSMFELVSNAKNDLSRPRKTLMVSEIAFLCAYSAFAFDCN